jgi:hypothetical protein
MRAFADLVFSRLKLMDDEAIDATHGGLGLWDYGAYAQANNWQRHKGPELACERRLAELLSVQGYAVKRQARYPGLRKRCDLKLTLPCGCSFWLEIKRLNKTWWLRDRMNPWGYYSYLFYGDQNLTALLRRHSNSVFDEPGKLGALAPPDADYVGLLLIGFDTLGPVPTQPGGQLTNMLGQLGLTQAQGSLDHDIAELIRRTNLADPRWEFAYGGWDDLWRPRDRVRAFLWWRPAGDSAEPPAGHQQGQAGAAATSAPTRIDCRRPVLEAPGPSAEVPPTPTNGEWAAHVARVHAAAGSMAHLGGSVDEFLAEKHAENEREEAKSRERGLR